MTEQIESLCSPCMLSYADTYMFMKNFKSRAIWRYRMVNLQWSKFFGERDIPVVESGKGPIDNSSNGLLLRKTHSCHENFWILRT